MANKQRVDKLEQQIKPVKGFVVIYEDPDHQGVFYDKANPSEGKLLTPEDIARIKAENEIVFKVVYRDEPSKRKRGLD